MGHIADVYPLYAASNLLVLPSESEGSPNVILEAMAAKLPVVATAVGGVPEIIQSGENGMLVTYGDIEALSNTLEEVISNETLQKQLRNNGFSTIQKRFSVGTYVKTLLSVYESVMAAAR
jgi:glycosyltransferase involved in cell wall biosynthesis